MLSYGLHTVSDQGARVVEGPPGGNSRAGGEISDAAYRQQAAARENYATGKPAPGGPGIAASAGTPSSAVSGGGYALDPEQLAQHIERFERIADRIERQKNKWRAAYEAVSPPSPDEPAIRQADRARASIMIGLQANRAKLERMRTFIRQMKEASGSYVAHDDGTSEAFSSGGSDDGVGRRNADTGDLFKKGGGR